MSDFRDRFEQQLVDAAQRLPADETHGRSPRGERRQRQRRWRGAVASLATLAAAAALVVVLSPSRTPSPAPTRTSAEGHAAHEVPPPPREQLELLGVLRRPGTARDRPPALPEAMRFFRARGGDIRTDYARRVDTRGTVPILLVPVHNLKWFTHRKMDDVIIPNALCVYAKGINRDDGVGNCFTTAQVRRGLVTGQQGPRHYGLVPDGVARVVIHFADGHAPITGEVHDNAYVVQAPDPRYPTIIARAPSRIEWLDADGRPVPKR